MMVLKGVKAVFAKDKTTVTTYAYPSKSGYDYKLTKKTWKNKCSFCGATLKFNPKNVPEGELTCSRCGADFCCVSGKDKAAKVRGKLSPATVTANSVTQVAGSQTQTQYCSLSKAEALTQAKQGLNTSSAYNGTLTIPLIRDVRCGDLCKIAIPKFKQNTYYIDSIKEDIDNSTYTLDLLEGSNHLTSKYDGNYIIKGADGAILATSSNNPLNAKCSNVNMNIGLKDSSRIGKKIKLKGQSLGTVPKIYKWLRVSSAGGVGGWKYKKYGNHRVSSEKPTKFGPLSAEKCWTSKKANCCDFSWIMAKMCEGSGKKVGIKKATYTDLSGKQQGHMYNYYGSKYYDCSSAVQKTPDFKNVETL